MDRVIEMMRNPSSLAKATNSSSNNNNNIKKKKTSRNGSGSSINSSSKTPPPPPPCCDGKDGSLKRGPWTHEEDEVLSEFIRKEGEGRWRTLPKRAGLLRCGKSCRLRWINYLRPSLKRGHIAPDEEDLILRLHRLLGNRWSLIAGRIPGRTDNEIKNYWNTHLSKKLISQGIDPRTHKPLINSCSNSTAPLSDHSSKPIPPTALHHGHHNPISNTHHHHLINIANQNYDDDPNDAKLANNNAKDDQNLNNKATAGGASAKDDVSAIGSIRSNDHVVVSTNNNEGEDHVNYCSDDDVFSSFLNSLINEDAFAAHHYLQSEHNITTTFSQNNPN